MSQESVTYQLSKEILASLLWRRTFIRSPLFFVTLIQIFISIWLIYIGGKGPYLGIPVVIVSIWNPYRYYKRLLNIIENQPQMTDLKTLTFDSSTLIVVGPNWRNEFSWSHFKGFSEDDLYFYLHLSSRGFASIIPKAAFQSHQITRFRELAVLTNA